MSNNYLPVAAGIQKPLSVIQKPVAFYYRLIKTFHSFWSENSDGKGNVVCYKSAFQQDGTKCLVFFIHYGVKLWLLTSELSFTKSMETSLKERCLKIIANPELIKIHKSQLNLLPVSLKNELLKILCKRGNIKDLSILKQLINPKTTSIDLSEYEVTDDLLTCLFVCKNLTKLDLSLRRRQNRCITTEVLNTLFLHIPHLKSLEVPYCKELNDETIKIICENCKLLQELFIQYASITDLSLCLIGINLVHLSAINILGTQITDKGIQFLTSGPLSRTLVEINIDKCQNVTSYSSTIVAENCPNLTIFVSGPCSNNEELDLILNRNKSKVKQIFWSV